ncbi:RNHCP domain-containing protein [Candidatus Peribacteria bacterium]|nr:RNHCP domain-containing protein [Candidatus Peribacteria bacterium]
MTFIARQEPFTCEHCKAAVQELDNGSYRNHCPLCLFSKHVDEVGPGDRNSTCLGLMEPLRIDQHPKKGWMIVHQCLKCSKEMRNRTAPDDDVIGFAERQVKKFFAKNP